MGGRAAGGLWYMWHGVGAGAVRAGAGRGGGGSGGLAGGLALSERHEHDVQTTLDTPPGSLAAGCWLCCCVVGPNASRRQPAVKAADAADRLLPTRPSAFLRLPSARRT